MVWLWMIHPNINKITTIYRCWLIPEMDAKCRSNSQVTLHSWRTWIGDILCQRTPFQFHVLQGWGLTCWVFLHFVSIHHLNMNAGFQTSTTPCWNVQLSVAAVTSGNHRLSCLEGNWTSRVACCLPSWWLSLTASVRVICGTYHSYRVMQNLSRVRPQGINDVSPANQDLGGVQGFVLWKEESWWQ